MKWIAGIEKETVSVPAFLFAFTLVKSCKSYNEKQSAE